MRSERPCPRCARRRDAGEAAARARLSRRLWRAAGDPAAGRRIARGVRASRRTPRCSAEGLGAGGVLLPRARRPDRRALPRRRRAARHRGFAGPRDQRGDRLSRRSSARPIAPSPRRAARRCGCCSKPPTRGGRIAGLAITSPRRLGALVRVERGGEIAARAAAALDAARSRAFGARGEMRPAQTFAPPGFGLALIGAGARRARARSARSRRSLLWTLFSATIALRIAAAIAADVAPPAAAARGRRSARSTRWSWRCTARAR